MLTVVQISAATVATLLQSDVRAVMSNAFGEASTDGPLGVGDWCRGRVLSSDGCNFGESVNTDSKEGISTITIVGDPITPPQSGGVLKGADTDLDLRRSSSSSRSSSRAFDSSSLSEQIDVSQRRGIGDDMGMSYSEVLGTHEPTILALPTSALLVGYTSTSSGDSSNFDRMLVVLLSLSGISECMHLMCVSSHIP